MLNPAIQGKMKQMAVANTQKHIFLGIGVLTTIAMLTGCVSASIYQLSQPIGECNGSPVSLTVGDNQDTPDVYFDSEGSEIDLTFTGNIDDVAIEYRIGVYGDQGLATINPSLMGPSPTPSESPTTTPEPVPTGTNESFLDLFRYLDEEGIYFDLTETIGESPFDSSSDVSRFVSRSSDVYRVSDSVAGILIDSEYLGLDLVESQFIFALMSLPGSFLVKCVATEPATYVAALPMFPNLTVFDENPVLTVNEEGFQLVFPEALDPEGASASILALPRTHEEPLSENPKTDRWLQLFSASETSNAVEVEGTIGPDGVFEITDGISDAQFVTGETYNFMVFFTTGESRLQIGFFDLQIDDSGQGEFTQFEGDFMPLSSPARTIRPSIIDTRVLVPLSSKGLRTIEVVVTHPEQVTSALVGSTPVKSFRVGTGTLVIELPKLDPGIYDLTLNSGSSQITKPSFIDVAASKKLKRLVVAETTGKSIWKTKLQTSLRRNPDTVQVDCLAIVPEGTKSSPLRKKAKAMCSSVTNDEIKTRVVIKKRDAGSIGSVVLNFWN